MHRNKINKVYLCKGEAVFVLLFVLHLEVVERFPLRWRLRQRPDALHVAGRQEPVAAIQLSMVPVLIHFPSQDDDVTLVELEVAGLFALVAVERLTTGQLRDVLQRTQQNNHRPMRKKNTGILCSYNKTFTVIFFLLSHSEEEKE